MNKHKLKEEISFNNGAVLSVMVDYDGTDFWETNRPEAKFFKTLDALEDWINNIPASEIKGTTKYTLLTVYNRRFSG